MKVFILAQYDERVGEDIGYAEVNKKQRPPLYTGKPRELGSKNLLKTNGPCLVSIIATSGYQNVD